VLDVPKLPVPQVTFFVSEIGNKYVRERSFNELATKMMEEPAAEGDEKQADQRASAAVSVQKSSDQAPVSVSKAQPSREPETSVMKSVDRVGTAASIASAPE
jgi:hypothetical protein